MRRKYRRILTACLLIVTCLCLTACDDRGVFSSIPNPVASITMTDGRVMNFELYLSEAPNTVANFVSLANSGYYDGMEIYRVKAGILFQSGDVNGDGTGSTNYTIQGEFRANKIRNDLKHELGTISMARQESDYDSASTQFFVMCGSYPAYDGQYAAFGRMLKDGTESVIDYISGTPVDSNLRPLMQAPKIQTIRCETYGYTYEPYRLEK